MTDYFMAFLDNELLDLIVADTNRYHAVCAETYDVLPGSHEKEWVNTTRDELLTFIALTLLMPHS